MPQFPVLHNCDIAYWKQSRKFERFFTALGSAGQLRSNVLVPDFPVSRMMNGACISLRAFSAPLPEQGTGS
jgi:hypothetical protein